MKRVEIGGFVEKIILKFFFQQSLCSFAAQSSVQQSTFQCIINMTWRPCEKSAAVAENSRQQKKALNQAEEGSRFSSSEGDYESYDTESEGQDRERRQRHRRLRDVFRGQQGRDREAHGGGRRQAGRRRRHGRRRGQGAYVTMTCHLTHLDMHHIFMHT